TTTKWATWSTGVTWVDVQVGDFNGDGMADITGRALETGDWWTGLSNGSGFSTTLWATWSTGVTWVDVHVGNFTGVGASDIVGRAKETGDWWVAFSLDGLVTPPPPFSNIVVRIRAPSFYSSIWSTWSTGVTWADVQVGDFNGDGKAD